MFKFRNLLLIILTAFLCFYFYQRDVLQVDMGKIVVVAVVWLFCLFSKPEKIDYLIAAMIPLSYGFSTGYIFPVALICVWIKRKEMPKETILFLLAVMAMEFVHYPFYTFNHKINAVELINFLSVVALLGYYSYNQKANKYGMMMWFGIGCAIFGMFVMLNTFQSFSISDLMTGMVRMGMEGIKDNEDEIIAFAANPNALAFFMIVAISLMAVMLINKKGNKPIQIIVISVCTFAGFITVSRTFFICLVIVLIAVVMAIRKKFSALTSSVIITLLICISIIVLVQMDDLFAAFSERFSDDKTGSGRTNIIAYYHHWLIENPINYLFGTGCLFYLKYVGYDEAPHNGVQQIIVCYGLMGLIYFLILISCVIKKSKKYIKKNNLQWVPFIIVILFLQTIQSISPIIQITPLLAAFWALQANQGDEGRLERFKNDTYK